MTQVSVNSFDSVSDKTRDLTAPIVLLGNEAGIMN